MRPLDLVLLVGSPRRASINLRLAKALAAAAPESLRPRFLPLEALPFYNSDLEPNRPPEALEYLEALGRAQAVLIVSPEFNRSVPALLKNAIDWASKPLEANLWRDKPVALAGASPGLISTAAAQLHLRQILGALGAHVMGSECYLRFAGPDFISAEGVPAEAATQEFLAAYIRRFADFAGKLAA